MNSKQYIEPAKQINSKCHIHFYHTKVMLGTGIVTFITPATGQLVREDSVREQDSGAVPWPGRWLQAEQLSCRDDFIPKPRLPPSSPLSSPTHPHLWLIGLKFYSSAETMDYWVSSSVSKRPGHLKAVLYWSVCRSHHWLSHADPVDGRCCAAVQSTPVPRWAWKWL